VTVFLDSAVLMYAAGGAHPLREPCRRVLRQVADGELEAVTSAEVIQEILHRFTRIGRADIGAALARASLDLLAPVLPITHALMRRLPDLIERYPHLEARERYRRADIVVDQFNSGWYGMFALESMALGKPVVARLEPEMVERSAEGLGARVPIVSATPETLVEALRPLVESPERRRELGAAGRAYVEAVHDVDRIADSCGYAVPRMNLVGDRDRLVQWSVRKGTDGLVAYRRETNARSIDGLPGIDP